MKLVLSATLVLMICVVVLMIKPSATDAQGQRDPIIDMHVHAYPADLFGKRPPNPATGQPSVAETDQEIERESLAALQRYNIVRAFTCGRPEIVRRWKASAPDQVIASLEFPSDEEWPGLASLRAAYTAGQLEGMGELTLQYAGLTLSSPEMEPYLALAEQLDIPVAVHTGHGPPGVTYQEPCCPKFRAALGSPLLIEESLVRHPKLRVYIMHAGYPFLEDTIALLHAHPQVYADLAVIDWIISREEFHDYLRRLLRHSDDCNLAKRLMFGSDQMVWPEAIGMAVEGVESADFLTTGQKRDIFCNNAARFLRLDPAICQPRPSEKR